MATKKSTKKSGSKTVVGSDGKTKKVLIGSKADPDVNKSSGNRNTSSSSSSGSSPIIQSVGGSREQQLANANAQMANIQKMMAEPSTKLTSAQSSSISSQLGQASTALASLPKASAPTVPGAIKPDVPVTKIPETPVTVGDTTDSAAYMAKDQARADAIEQKKQDALAREQANNEAQQPWLDKMMQSFNNTQRVVTDSIERQDEAWNDYLAQAEGSRAEIKSYNDKYAETEAAMNAQIAQTNDSMGSMNFISNQIKSIRDNAAPTLNLLAAKSANASADLALIQGDYEIADKHLQNAVENMTALSKFQYDTAKDFMTVNQDIFDRTESIYSEAYTEKLAQLKEDYDRDVLENNTKRELILAYNADGAGIKMTDSLDEAYRKAGTTNTQARRLAEAQITNAGSGGSGNSNQMTDNERALFGQFRSEPIVKDYNTILSKKLSVDAIIDSGVGGPGDLALVYEFMKGLDPTSVVRETEYATAAKSGNIFLGSLARFNGYFKAEGGFMPDNVKESFRSIVGSKLDVQTRLYENTANEYVNMAVRQGLNPDNVVLGYSKAAPSVAPIAQGMLTPQQVSSETDGVTFSQPNTGVLTKFVNWVDGFF